MVIKKYSNRRLYDTDRSRYVTLDEVAETIRAGADLTFVDVPSGADITQPMLAQIILESRGAARLLPVHLLRQLIRMEDEAVAEFFGRWVGWAMETYLRARQGAQALVPLNPLAHRLPAGAADLLSKLLSAASSAGAANAGGWGAPEPPPPTTAPPREPAPSLDALAELRKELDEIRAELAAQRPPVADADG